MPLAVSRMTLNIDNNYTIRVATLEFYKFTRRNIFYLIPYYAAIINLINRKSKSHNNRPVRHRSK